MDLEICLENPENVAHNNTEVPLSISLTLKLPEAVVWLKMREAENPVEMAPDEKLKLR